MNKRPRKRGRRAATADLSHAPEPLVFSLLGTAHAVEARLETALSRAGLSLAKAGLLKCLADAREPVPLSELAQHQHCVRSNITQLVDRLEKDGLVRRRADATDRRSVRAALTPAGERAYAQAVQVLAREQRAIERALAPGDAVNLKGVLKLLAR
jgi:DNA-binding MarR family transcriptional regulator